MVLGLIKHWLPAYHYHYHCHCHCRNSLCIDFDLVSFIYKNNNNGVVVAWKRVSHYLTVVL